MMPSPLTALWKKERLGEFYRLGPVGADHAELTAKARLANRPRSRHDAEFGG
jgi:hypothetical protein